MRFFILLLLLLKINSVLAQDNVLLLGKVMDESGKELEGVKVYIIGFNWTETVTNGEFEFKLPSSKFHIGDNIPLLFYLDKYQPLHRYVIIPMDPLKNPIYSTMKKIEEIKIFGIVINENNEHIKNVLVGIVGIGSIYTSQYGDFTFSLPASKVKVGDKITIHCFEDSYEARIISYIIPSDPIENPCIITMKSKLKIKDDNKTIHPVNIGFLFARKLVNNNDEQCLHGSIQYFPENNKWISIGVETGVYEQTFFQTYYTLPGLHENTKKISKYDDYLGISTRFFLRGNRNNNPAPYLGLIASIPHHYQLILGTNLESLGPVFLGIELRSIYYKSEKYNIIFNRFGNAIIKPSKEYISRFILGINIGFNF